MSETLTHFQAASHDIVNLAAMALSAAPELSDAERTSRSQTVIRGTLAFQPADSAQTVLSTEILGHHLAIMDGFRDLARMTLTPAEAARARMVTVAQTKVVLQLLRELRIERAEALPRLAAEPTQEAADDAGYEAVLTNFQTTYTDALATLENTGTLTPAVAATAREALSQALPPALSAASRQEPIPVTGSRAQRRAIMKRNGAFKRHG
jgi:hypothetical protein